MSTPRLILDVDTGEDDALAILLAVRMGLPLAYVFTSYGNTTLANATRNSAGLLSLLDRPDIPVLPLADTSLQPHPRENLIAATTGFVGADGLCQTPLPPNRFDNILQPADPWAKAAAILHDEGPFTYFATGPCTNLARLCQRLGPEIQRCIPRVIIMGGALLAPGNSGARDEAGKAAAEFNFYNDAEAVEIVLQAGLAIELVSWDITRLVTLPPETVAGLQADEPVGQFAIQLMQNFLAHYGIAHNRPFELNDPLTLLTYLGWGHQEPLRIKMECAGDQYGRSYLAGDGYPISYWQLAEEDWDAAKQTILEALGVRAG